MKEISVELDGDELLLDVDYEYYHLSARLCGKPEDCYPEEESSYIELPGNLEGMVTEWALSMVPKWVKQIEDHTTQLIKDCKPREWAEEDNFDN